MAAIERKTYCRVCGAGCGIIVELDGERVLKIRGDKDHPVSKGYTCAKGRALPDMHHSSDRLHVPLIRNGGALQRTSWNHLLDDLAAKLKRILDESGPRAVGMFCGGGGYSDAGAYFSTRAFRSGIKTPSAYSDMSIDVICKLIVSEMMAGFPGFTSKADDTCKLIIFIGTNPFVSHGHTAGISVPAVEMRKMLARGEVWVIDPRRTETARHATRHLAARAGTDYAILGFLTRELLREGADHEYIKNHTQDLNALREVVERFSIERTAAVTGVDTRDLSDLLAAVRRAGRVCVETGTGVSMARSANVTQWLSWTVMIVTGSLDREGGAWFNPGFFSQRDRMQLPPPAPVCGRAEPGPASRPELRGLGGEYPCAAMADEIETGNLRALVNFGGNLVACMPDVERTVSSLNKLDVLASIEINATDTTAISTHVLPSKGHLERPDLTLGLEVPYPVVGAQYAPQVVKPLGETKSVWWMIAQLGKRIGIDFFPGIDADAGTDEEVFRLLTSKARLSLDEIKSTPLAVADRKVIGWVQRYVDEKVGGWRMAPPKLIQQLEEVEKEAAGRAPLVLIPRRQSYHINSKLLGLRDRPSILVSPQDAQVAGLKDGATVLVQSEHGSVQGVMKIDPTLSRGVMSIPHGWSNEYNVNRLTHGRDVDPVSGMPRYSGLSVTLHAV